MTTTATETQALVAIEDAVSAVAGCSHGTENLPDRQSERERERERERDGTVAVRGGGSSLPNEPGVAMRHEPGLPMEPALMRVEGVVARIRNKHTAPPPHDLRGRPRPKSVDRLEHLVQDVAGEQRFGPLRRLRSRP